MSLDLTDNHIYLKCSVNVIGTPDLKLTTHKLIDVCNYISGRYWNPVHYYGNQANKRAKKHKKKNAGNCIYFTNTRLC